MSSFKYPATGGGSGDIVGPASSSNGGIALFDGTTGKLLKQATGSGVVKAASGVYSASAVNLASEVTGVVPVANGGTNSSVALSNNRVIKSAGGAIVEAAAITAARALISDANGIPVHSGVTATTLAFLDATSSVQSQLDAKVETLADLGVNASATELNYVVGVTSGVQTQLDAKAETLADLGVTADASEVNTLDGITASTAELNYCDGVTSGIQGQLDAKPDTLADLGVTADASELNVLDGMTASTAELNYVDGVTSAIQTQLDAKLCCTSVAAVSSDITLTNKRIHFVDTSSARSLTLPAPSTTSYLVIKDKTGNAAANNITVVRSGSEKIETASASYTLETGLGSWTFVSDGTDWFII